MAYGIASIIDPDEEDYNDIEYCVYIGCFFSIPKVTIKKKDIQPDLNAFLIKEKITASDSLLINEDTTLIDDSGKLGEVFSRNSDPYQFPITAQMVTDHLHAFEKKHKTMCEAFFKKFGVPLVAEYGAVSFARYE
jgi:hypothetical protein